MNVVLNDTEIVVEVWHVRKRSAGPLRRYGIRGLRKSEVVRNLSIFSAFNWQINLRKICSNFVLQKKRSSSQILRVRVKFASSQKTTYPSPLSYFKNMSSGRKKKKAGMTTSATTASVTTASVTTATATTTSSASQSSQKRRPMLKRRPSLKLKPPGKHFDSSSTAAAADKKMLRLPDGAIVFEQGDLGTQSYRIVDGAIRVLVGFGPMALRKEIAVLTKGNSFGDVALHSPTSCRTATCVAHGITELIITGTNPTTSIVPSLTSLLQENLQEKSVYSGTSKCNAKEIFFFFFWYDYFI